MTPKFLDASHYDDLQNVAKVKAAGILGWINKATEGPGMVDKTFAIRRPVVLGVGLKYGAYYFLRPGDQEAHAALVNHPSVWAGPNADALVGNICGPSANAACRQSDGTHWSDNGSYSYAAAWVTALEAYGSPF